MEIIKKYIGLLVVAFVVLVGAFLISYRFYSSVKAVEDLSASYETFDKAISEFSITVFASNPEGASTLDQFNNIYSQITASMQDTRRNGDRLALAIEAISLNNDLLEYLNRTDDSETTAGGALIALNTKASARISSLIRNDAKLMSKALEIADFSAKELDILKA